MSNNKVYPCIFCLEQKDVFSIEHIIPAAILSNPEIDITLQNRVCEKCNKKFGHKIDSDFLNSTHIKYLRWKHDLYLNQNKMPYIKEKEPIYLIDIQGNEIPFYRKHKKNGTIEYEQSKKVKIKYGSINFNSEENSRIMNNFTASVNFTQFICKMALEYICRTQGDSIAYNNKFNIIREFVNGTICSTLPPPYLMRITDMAIDNQNAPYNSIKHDRHTIGIINKSDGGWQFFFSIFNVTTFYLIIDNGLDYKEIKEEIIISKNNQQAMHAINGGLSPDSNLLN